VKKKSLLPEINKIVIAAGKYIRKESKHIRPNDGKDKAYHDPVSFVDHRAEELLVNGLSSLLPDAGFIAEEGTGERNPDGYNWIIDPLDGTLNFLHGIPMYSISVALAENEHLLSGVVYEITRNEIFYAERGTGAYCNGKAIRHSNILTMENSLFATGFPFRDYSRINQYLSLLQLMMNETKGIRRMGSAAVDLCYTAAGRFEGYFEYGLKPWDIAAGIVIAREAKCIISDFQENENNWSGEDILAVNPYLYHEFVNFVHKHFKKYV